jgi:dihydrolipoamide dehydrogenase
MSHAADYGINLEGTVAPDFQAVVKRSRGVAEQMSKGVQFLLKKNNVDVIAGFGKLAGNHQVEVTAADGTKTLYEAKHIILATGARSRSLPNVPQDGKKIIGYREALTLPELPKTMVVMGSGAIGSELAYFYATMGTQVTIVEYMPRLVPVEDDDIAAQLARCFRKHGIKTMTGAAVEKVEVVNDQCVVTIKDSKEKITEITCDIVLSAVGVATNLEGLGLEECGVAFERGKVTVDDY